MKGFKLEPVVIDVIEHFENPGCVECNDTGKAIKSIEKIGVYQEDNKYKLIFKLQYKPEKIKADYEIFTTGFLQISSMGFAFSQVEQIDSPKYIDIEIDSYTYDHLKALVDNGEMNNITAIINVTTIAMNVVKAQQAKDVTKRILEKLGVAPPKSKKEDVYVNCQIKNLRSIETNSGYFRDDYQMICSSVERDIGSSLVRLNVRIDSERFNFDPNAYDYARKIYVCTNIRQPTGGLYTTSTSFDVLNIGGFVEFSIEIPKEFFYKDDISMDIYAYDLTKDQYEQNMIPFHKIAENFSAKINTSKTFIHDVFAATFNGASSSCFIWSNNCIGALYSSEYDHNRFIQFAIPYFIKDNKIMNSIIDYIAKIKINDTEYVTPIETRECKDMEYFTVSFRIDEEDFNTFIDQLEQKQPVKLHFEHFEESW